MNLSDRTSESANNMTFSDQHRFTKSPQVILLSLVHIRLTPKWSVCRRQLPPVRRLLDAARSNNQVLDQTDVLKSKIDTSVMQGVRCVLSTKAIPMLFVISPQFGSVMPWILRGCLKLQNVTYADVLSLTSQISPPICGCQIMIPSYCSRHARIFNVQKSPILKKESIRLPYEGFRNTR